jgi:nucleoside-diphosphate kinase
MVKPDAVQRGIAFSILKRWEKRGYTLSGLKMVVPTQEQAESHYEEHRGKGFFPAVTSFLASGPVVCAAFTGPNAISASRQILGKTNPVAAEMGTIRGDFAVSGAYNTCHASDSQEAAEREINLWFKKEEIIDWKRDAQKWVWD